VVTEVKELGWAGFSLTPKWMFLHPKNRSTVCVNAISSEYKSKILGRGNTEDRICLMEELVLIK